MNKAQNVLFDPIISHNFINKPIWKNQTYKKNKICLEKNFYDNIIPSIIKSGCSGWSNAFVWGYSLLQNRASMAGGNMQFKRLFEDKKIVEIDPYPWPYNIKCGFW